MNRRKSRIWVIVGVIVGLLLIIAFGALLGYAVMVMILVLGRL
jgi:putative Ca2+/H+ antiporter (TMEM165/GDT1 family)